MKIGIIDAEIIGKSKHRFPNLVCMKISSYHKSKGDSVTLLLDYDSVDDYDRVYISKVFTDTEIPCEPVDKTGKSCDTIKEWYADNPFLKRPNIEYGGTGFYYRDAPPLPDVIEHSFPDYHLYDEWVEMCIEKAVSKDDMDEDEYIAKCKRIARQFEYYTDYSIGYLTRKCFRGCKFCVNGNYKKVESASPLSEFMDITRPKLCFLDDNFFGYPCWKELIEPVIQSGKRFQFKQGLDERLLTADKISAMAKWKYDNEMIFAFDNIKDKELIISKLKLIREVAPNWKRELKFYVFCGFDRADVWDDKFWEQDIRDLFERITILRAYGAKPYVMRYERVYDSEYAPFYAAVASYCNQPSMFTSFSFRLFCQCRGMRKEGYKKYKRDIDAYLKNVGFKGSEWRSMEAIAERFPDIAYRYFDINSESDLSEWVNGTAPASRSEWLAKLLEV